MLPKTVLNASEHPVALDAHDEYKAFVATRFDFRGKLVNIVEQLKVKANKAKGYGIIVQDNVIAFITMVNVEWAARQN